jgi:hypothetical protein
MLAWLAEAPKQAAAQMTTAANVRLGMMIFTAIV